MTITIHETSRGFLKGEFQDRYAASCSIQESSLAEEPAIWLGVDGPAPGSRMHLTQEMVFDLLPLLQRFAYTGRLTP